MTLGTSKRRCAIWAIVRFVLSPSVEAMKTSASSMPGLEQRVDLERRADGEAPAGVLPRACPARRRGARARGSSSRTETSCPADSALRATADPTRPAPTKHEDHHVPEQVRRPPADRVL